MNIRGGSEQQQSQGNIRPARSINTKRVLAHVSKKETTSRNYCSKDRELVVRSCPKCRVSLDTAHTIWEAFTDANTNWGREEGSLDNGDGDERRGASSSP